jgi:hypothetical protein
MENCYKASDKTELRRKLLFRTISSKLKAFIERFYCIAEEDPNPPLGRYEKYPVKDAALLMTSADDLFWTYEQAVSYYKFTVINYIGFHDKGMILAGGCGDTNGKPQIDKIDYLKKHMDLEKQFIMNNINRNLWRDFLNFPYFTSFPAH